jgi:hypothetical protein
LGTVVSAPPLGGANVDILAPVRPDLRLADGMSVLRTSLRPAIGVTMLRLRLQSHRMGLLAVASASAAAGLE